MAAQAFISFSRRRRIGWFVGLWFVAEIVAFAIVVKLVGVGGAVLLGLGTSLLGAAMLRRLGFAAARHVGAALQGRSPDAPMPGKLVDSVLGSVAALLLIVPGFLSDAVGLLLAVPAIRGIAIKAVAAFSGITLATPPQRPDRPDVIDLAPSDWRVVDDPARRPQ